MDSTIIKKLIKWKNSKDRKPLILRGANQISKINIINQFGNVNYDEIVYFNFKNNQDLSKLFNKEKNTIKILKQLSIISSKSIMPERTLIVFDEIQEDSNILNSLKFFYEEANEYHIICTGSSLGKLLADRAFAVGNVNILDIL